MKKIILLAAFGVAGLVNAKKHSGIKSLFQGYRNQRRGKGKQSKSIWMYASFIQTSWDLIHTQHGVANGEPSV